MSPKFRLSNHATPPRVTRSHGHTILLPLAMLFVVGSTFLLITLTKPVSLAETRKEHQFEPAGANITGMEFDGLEKRKVRDLSASLPFGPGEKSRSRPLRTYQESRARPLQTNQKSRARPIKKPFPSPACPNEGYLKEGEVYGKKLAQVRPIDELRRDLPLMNPVDPHQQPAFKPTPPPPNVRAIPQAIPIENEAWIDDIYSEQASNVMTTKAKELPPHPNQCPQPAQCVNGEIHLSFPGKSPHAESINFVRPITLDLKPFLSRELKEHEVLELAIEATPKITVGGECVVDCPPKMTMKLQIGSTGFPAARVVSAPSVNEASFCSAAPLKHCSDQLVDQFTPWMTPAQLNHYILQKNQGYRQSFWERGHWIVAVEGRQYHGLHQYRIVYQKAPTKGVYQWRYRIAQSKQEYLEKLNACENSGFMLVQSQMYIDSQNEPRFQAVWHRLH